MHSCKGERFRSIVSRKWLPKSKGRSHFPPNEHALFSAGFSSPPFAFAGAGVTSKTPQLLSHVGCLRGIPTDSMTSRVDFLSP